MEAVRYIHNQTLLQTCSITKHDSHVTINMISALFCDLNAEPIEIML